MAYSWVGGVLGASDYRASIVIKESSCDNLQSPPALASVLETKTVSQPTIDFSLDSNHPIPKRKQAKYLVFSLLTAAVKATAAAVASSGRHWKVTGAGVVFTP